MPALHPDPRPAAAAAAQRWFTKADMVDALVRERGHITEPIPLVDPEAHEQVSWFVPVIVGSALAGFFVFDDGLVLKRWSTFQRRPLTLDGCPDAADWLDRSRIVARAEAAVGARAGTAGAPFLSYDTVPDRIAWIVPVGDVRVYVAGSASWQA